MSADERRFLSRRMGSAVADSGEKGRGGACESLHLQFFYDDDALMPLLDTHERVSLFLENTSLTAKLTAKRRGVDSFLCWRNAPWKAVRTRFVPQLPCCIQPWSQTAFSMLMRCTPHQYVIHCLVEQAKLLLTTTKWSLAGSNAFQTKASMTSLHFHHKESTIEGGEARRHSYPLGREPSNALGA
ncbi:hypothetical protein Krac_6947 [Ktedonobacter racemifer DSM 44963]|uniref:Uncharacterized protein n=1 Tax=Ktedonobacter racemifer DSM 44963 TaxID=485913 RepID=D6TQ69_KTERA|nr:hypothetical protein Krac_6947 [Ktedonobacter racemifer DSM 44963]